MAPMSWELGLPDLSEELERAKRLLPVEEESASGSGRVITSIYSGLSMQNIHPDLNREQVERIAPKDLNVTYTPGGAIAAIEGTDLWEDGRVILKAGASREEARKVLSKYHEHGREATMEGSVVTFGIGWMGLHFAKNPEASRDELTNIVLVGGVAINYATLPADWHEVQY